MNDCVFCKIAAGEIPSQKVYEDDNVFAFQDIHPQAPQHALIIPKKHIGMLADACDQDQELLGALLLAAVRIARGNGTDSDGFRVVVNNGESAGQSVLHLHLHLLSGRSFQWPPG